MEYFKNVWKILSAEQRRKSLILFFLILVSTLLEVLGIGLIVPVILFFVEDNIVIKYPYLNFIVSYFFEEPDKIDYMKFGLILLIFVYLVKNFFLVFFAYYESRFTHGVQASISNKIFNYYLFEDLSFHNKTNSSLLINNLTKEIQMFTNSLIHLIILITEIFVFFGISFLLLYYQPKGFLIISAISFSVIWSYNFFTSKKLLNLGEKRLFTAGLIIQKIQQGLGGLREIKIYNRELGFLNLFRKSTKDLYHILWVSDLIRKIPRFLLEFIAVFSLAVVVLILINLGIGKSEIITILGLFGLAAARILPSLNRIFNAFQRIQFGYAATELVRNELEKSESRIKKNTYIKEKTVNENSSSKIKLNFNNSIKVKNLTFSYSENKTKIFEKVNFEIKKGHVVGIKGSSGSGKSTLVDIILGLLQPSDGKVLVDDKDILENLNLWQQKASYVPQDVFLTDDKLSRNIALGIEDEKIDKKKLEYALYASELDKFVSSLPQGIETIVGERGSRLSGGQRQRIGLARALYHNPELLVLDETTNSLDKETEEKIMKTIFKIKKNRTIIIISHDERLLKNCDLIYSIQNKNIYEN